MNLLLRSEMLIVACMFTAVANLRADEDSGCKGYGLKDYACGNGIAVRVSRQGRIETSNDGNTWAEQPLGIRTFVRGVASLAFGNGRFVARGEVGTILTSTNANEWAARRLEDSLYVGRIIFQDNVFLVRSSDCVFSTTTGSMWAWQQVETAKIP